MDINLLQPVTLRRSSIFQQNKYLHSAHLPRVALPSRVALSR